MINPFEFVRRLFHRKPVFGTPLFGTIRFKELRVPLYNGNNLDEVLDSIRAVCPGLNDYYDGHQTFDDPDYCGHRWNMSVGFHNGDKRMGFWNHEAGSHRGWSAGSSDQLNEGWYSVKFHSVGNWNGRMDDSLAAAIVWFLKDDNITKDE